MSQLLSEPTPFSFFSCCAGSWLVGWSWAAQYPSKKQLPKGTWSQYPKRELSENEQRETCGFFLWGGGNKAARIPRALIGSSHYSSNGPLWILQKMSSSFALFSSRLFTATPATTTFWLFRISHAHFTLLTNHAIVARHQTFSLALATLWNSGPQILASKTKGFVSQDSTFWGQTREGSFQNSNFIGKKVVLRVSDIDSSRN